MVVWKLSKERELSAKYMALVFIADGRPVSKSFISESVVCKKALLIFISGKARVVKRSNSPHHVRPLLHELRYYLLKLAIESEFFWN